MDRSEAVTIFDYGTSFLNQKLPEGFKIIDGTQVDYAKLSDCYWRGFDNNEAPPAINIDGEH